MALTTVQGSAVFHDRSGYIVWGETGTDFASRLASWQPGDKWSEDDNFFISRVGPRKRFVNRQSQVNPWLDDENDKNLIWWLPIGTPPFNALPGGNFDSDIFPAWAYVTHLGDWSAPLARVPGALLDAAHRNGVPVSALATIPYGDLTDEWLETLKTLQTIGPDRLADYLSYYGIDGIGYNSEFRARPSLITGLASLNSETVSLLHQRGNTAAQFIWYDGTNSNGAITFDSGLGEHNKNLWGIGKNDHSALFFNYNWNKHYLLSNSVDNAHIYGRNPLDLYCGINLQGREPKDISDGIWTLLAQYPVSIGLWGGHSENMLFESRSDNAVSAIDRQSNYIDRIIRWFSGSNGNPACPPELSESLVYSVNGGEFPGMARFMSARSALKWDLDNEPFFTAFNLGNGRFFNYDGHRCHNSDWYDLSTQDYLPTWMWWLADTWLGHEVSGDIKAGFTWDDAWLGGSCIRIAGSTRHSFLHLFKTEYSLKSGDRITLRYKRLNGQATIRLAIGLKNSSSPQCAAQGATPIPITVPSSSPQCAAQGAATIALSPLGLWQELTLTAGEDLLLPPDAEAAVIALEFDDAKDLDLLLGSLEIRRPRTSPIPSAPVIETARLMYADRDGVDAKIIFSVPNDKENEVCYNDDVNVSAFKIYAQSDGDSPVLMGLTTSWAALPCNIPYSGNEDSAIRLGVSSLSLDRTSESAIVWSEPLKVSPVFADTHSEIPDPLPDELSPPRLATLECGDTQISDFSTTPVFNVKNDDVAIRYTLRDTPHPASRGLVLGMHSAGFRMSKAGIGAGDPFAVEFSIHPDEPDGMPTHLVSIRDKMAEWPLNNYGWFRHTLNPDGTTESFIIRDINGMEIPYIVKNFRLQPGRWYRLRYEFDYTPDSEEFMPRLFCDGREIPLVSAHPEGLNPWGGWTGWTKGMHFEIGGYIHKKNPVGGVIDDVCVYPQHPSPECISFDFESEPAADNLWNSTFGLIHYDDTETEGQGLPRYITPEYAAGEPEAAGSAFTDFHNAQWYAPGALSVISSDTTEGGEAILHYDRSTVIGPTLDAKGPTPEGMSYYSGEMLTPGSFPVILELTNSNGSTLYDFIIKQDGAGIKTMEANHSTFTPHPAIFTTQTGVKVEEAGTYTLSLLDLAGRRLLSNNFHAREGDLLLVQPDVTTGPYLLLLERPGHPTVATPVLKK